MLLLALRLSRRLSPRNIPIDKSICSKVSIRSYFALLQFQTGAAAHASSHAAGHNWHWPLPNAFEPSSDLSTIGSTALCAGMLMGLSKYLLHLIRLHWGNLQPSAKESPTEFHTDLHYAFPHNLNHSSRSIIFPARLNYLPKQSVNRRLDRLS